MRTEYFPVSHSRERNNKKTETISGKIEEMRPKRTEKTHFIKMSMSVCVCMSIIMQRKLLLKFRPKLYNFHFLLSGIIFSNSPFLSLSPFVRLHTFSPLFFIWWMSQLCHIHTRIDIKMDENAKLNDTFLYVAYSSDPSS